MAERIGHYNIVAELGRGGMGIVYKAHEESLNRFVAIKVLGEHLTEDPTHVQRFLREAQSAARLNHPNIVQIYAISEDQGRHFFVMEYVTGRSLQKILRAKGSLDSIQTARIALQAASGLRAAHEQGIIHRDIKPANLLIDDRGLVKIADFGLALMGGAASRLTATGMFMGTPGYLSPEQCLNQDIDHRTDIYSLGVTLFEALSGKAPFTGDSPLALLRQIIDVEPPDLADLKPDVDPELRALVARMMAKNPDLRVSSCAELIGALEGFLAARGITGSLLERVAVASGGTVPSPPKADDDLGSQPTTAVSGDLPEPDAPPVTAPAERAETPVIESAPLMQPAPGGGRKLALVAALVVILGLAAVAIGGFVAWRSGIFGLATRQAAHRAEPAAPTEEAVQTEVSDQQGGDEATEASKLGAGGPAAPSVSEDQQNKARDIKRPTLGPQQQTERSIPPQSPDQPREQAARVPEREPPPVLPPPDGTVVIVVGEQLLAGEAENYIESALARAGLPLVDEAGIPGLGALLSGTEDPRPGRAHELLRPYARNLIMVRIEYLGERPLVYMGQRDVAFQARVSMVPIDVAAGGALEQPTRFRVEYTHLNADRVVEKEFRRPTAHLVQLLANR